jgi:hypothetical protein
MNDYSALLGNMCQACSIALSSSLSSFVWQIISFIWPWHWIWITIILFGWIIWELITRYKDVHYNSANGFSPTFNKFVGSGSYLLTQTILFMILNSAYGEMVFCFRLTYVLHAASISIVGLTLHFSGFWPYLSEPGRKRVRRY